ncbi:MULTISPECIES: hypothetical protein [unclassified Rhizobium]|uniref:hypothetical protein n=1 Tax=unclassified Rhizobium TaxID=2613769 RepID=UPI000AD6934A|nr:MULTISPECIES: hypothetical protein [unclassified Rhizobium]
MPTLVRFLIICLIIAGAIYATMLALVTFVDPAERDVTIRIPPERLDTERLAPR